MRARPGPAGWAGAAWVAVILLICLSPNANRTASVVQWCILCGVEGAIPSFMLNVALFLPLGLAVRLRTGSTLAALALGLALSLGIEVVQLWVPGRYSTLGDLLANTGGAGLGGLMGIRPLAWLLPDRRTAMRLSIGWAVTAGVAVALPGALSMPSVGARPLYASWTPRLPGLAVYRGLVVAADVDGLPLPPGLLDEPDRVSHLIESGSALNIVIQAGPAPSELAPLFRMVGGPYGVGEDVLQVGIDGSDIVFQPPYLAKDLRLARPELIVWGGLSGVSLGDTVTLSLAPDPRGGHLVSVDGRTTRLGLTSGRGWAFVRRPGSMSARARERLDLLWIAMLLAPLGWWAPTRSALAIGSSLPLLLLAATPWWTPLLQSGPLAYVAAVTGLAAGRILRRLTAARPSSARSNPVAETDTSGSLLADERAG